MKKIIYFITIILIFVANVLAQNVEQSINLKQGFNFVSFTVQPSITPQQLKNQYLAIEDVYLYSAASGSFLSILEGSLTSLSAGKGYIIKVTDAAGIAINVAGTSLANLTSANLKSGFNLIGISTSPISKSFSQLMNQYSIIKGIYKWSPAAGGFIQVIKDDQGQPVQVDGADPQFKIGESYFINITEDSKMNFDGGYITLGGESVTSSKMLTITGEVGSGSLASYLGAASLNFSGSGYRVSMFDEVNNIPIEGSSISLTGSNSFKASVPLGNDNRYAVISVKEGSDKVVFKNLVGRIPKSSEVMTNEISLSGIKLNEQTTAKALLILEDKIKVPDEAFVTADFDASATKTEFEKKVDERINDADSNVNELSKAVDIISKILISSDVNSSIKSKITIDTFSNVTSLLNSFVDILQDTTELELKNKLKVPSSIVIGNNVIAADSKKNSENITKAAVSIKNGIKDQVAVPLVNLSAGTYSSPQTIIITCVTKDALIKYTIDGTVPSSENGINYGSSPI